MPKVSAGLLMYRIKDGVLQVLLAHPGGPFWQGKNQGTWTIPKGELDEGEAPLDAAQREFNEETGLTPCGPFIALTPIKQRSGKIVHAWAFAGDCDPACLRSNSFELQWPPKSGKYINVAEVDSIEFFTIDEARIRINPAQIALLDELLGALIERGLHSVEPAQPTG